MKIVPVLVLTLVVSLAASPVLEAGQSQTLEKPIRVTVNEVPVDVIVTDRHGNPVLDLTRKDFTVLEDGVPQKIAHFSINSFRTPDQRIEGTGPTQTGGRSEPAVRDPEHRTILILAGRGELRVPSTIPKLIDFVRAGLQPRDRIAFMAFSHVTDFTTDHEKLVPVLKRFQKISPLIEKKIVAMSSRLALRHGHPESLKHFLEDIDRIFDVSEGGSRTVTATYVPALDEEAARKRDLFESMQQIEEEEMAASNRGVEESDPSAKGEAGSVSARVQKELLLDGMGLDEYRQLESKEKVDQSGLSAAIEYLRHLDGEKHIIFLNDQGLALTGLNNDFGLPSIASDARVRIHSIQLGGMYLGVPANSVFSAANPSAISSFPTRFAGTFRNTFALRSVRNLARNTGGQSFARQDLSVCLETIGRTTSVTYLLGYVPEKKELDGRFRHIEVRVDRPDLRVLHRRGYYAARTPKLYDREEFLVHSRITTAAVSEELIHDVDFSLRTQLVAGARPNLLQANLQVHPAASIYVRKDDRYAGKLAISYFIFGRDGDLVSEIWDDLDMALKPTTYERVLREGFPLEKQLEVPSGSKECLLRVVVYDVANDRVGSAEALIEGKR